MAQPTWLKQQKFISPKARGWKFKTKGVEHLVSGKSSRYSLQAASFLLCHLLMEVERALGASSRNRCSPLITGAYFPVHLPRVPPLESITSAKRPTMPILQERNCIYFHVKHASSFHGLKIQTHLVTIVTSNEGPHSVTQEHTETADRSQS